MGGTFSVRKDNLKWDILKVVAGKIVVSERGYPEFSSNGKRKWDNFVMNEACKYLA